jgi:F-type H+-transporting ATPase subunit epsilon
MADFRLQIVTTERVVFDGIVTSIIAPGASGYLGVLANHAPLLTTLVPGTLTVRHGDQVTLYHITGGFLEVNQNVATLLADSLETLGLEEQRSVI